MDRAISAGMPIICPEADFEVAHLADSPANAADRVALPLPWKNHMGLRQEPLVLFIFLVAQALDGTLTYAGIRQMGVGVELNQLLVFYMDTFGIGLTLVGAKTMACACGLILYAAHYHRPLAVAAGAYLGLAVVPWIVALSPFL